MWTLIVMMVMSLLCRAEMLQFEDLSVTESISGNGSSHYS